MIILTVYYNEVFISIHLYLYLNVYFKDADTEYVLEDKEAITGQALHSSRDVPAVDNVKSIYLKIDRSHLRVKDDDIDFRYLSDAVPHKPFFPAALCK